ncbi:MULTISPECIES: hypothetical protein [unclassified Sphingopyxis]|uniref:hypothetical protein n=1 Tax=unclassified Sphingopyxis TaxID=2614943 RepID=UPI0025CF5FBD|nr:MULTISPECIES: hypothetical protein [unclassified Sphingopyxis]
MKILLWIALLLSPERTSPPSMDAYSCAMEGRPGGEKFTLLIRSGSGQSWISDGGGLQRHSVKRSTETITIGEEVAPASDGGGFEIAYELDRKTLFIRLLVLVGGKIDASLQGRCEQFKHVATPPGLKRATPIAPAPIMPRN